MVADVKVSIEVDAFDTNRMIERTLKAVDGISLEEYLRGPAHEYLEHEIVQRFAYEGDKKSGDWAPLSEATRTIRRELGYDEEGTNIRSGEMFRILTHDADFYPGTNSAEMSLPGSAGTRGQMAQKMQTATRGRANNPMPGFGPTPPRPVLAVDEMDMAALLEALNIWIIGEIAGTF